MNTAIDNVYRFPGREPEERPVTPDKPEGNVASLDDGYYRTATSIGRLKSKLKMSGQEHQVFDAVIMCTFGWNKSEDKVTNTYIADMTDLDDSDVSKALNKLANRRIINLRKSGLFKIISVNKKLDEWVLSRQKTEKVKSPKRLGETTQEVGRFDLSSLVKSPNTKDSLTKDNNIKNPTSENSDESSDPPKSKSVSVRPDAAVSSPKGNQWGTADDLKAAQWIYCKVKIVFPAAQEPTWHGWANDIRLMRQVDNRTHEEICRLFQWANKDPFWCSNVLCPAKLREKWGTLVIQSQQPGRSQRNAAPEQPVEWNTVESWEGFL